MHSNIPNIVNTYASIFVRFLRAIESLVRILQVALTKYGRMYQEESGIDEFYVNKAGKVWKRVRVKWRKKL